MAFAFRITASTNNGQEVKIEPSWWNIDQLRSKYNFKEELNYYLDYYLYVDKQTFQEIIKSQEKYNKKEIYDDELWNLENDQTTTELDDLVKNIEEDSTIEIWIYEWESVSDFFPCEFLRKENY